MMNWIHEQTLETQFIGSGRICDAKCEQLWLSITFGNPWLALLYIFVAVGLFVLTVHLLSPQGETVRYLAHPDSAHPLRWLLLVAGAFGLLIVVTSCIAFLT